MSTIIIEKYVDGIREEQLRLPAAPVRLLARFLPGSARRSLLGQGLDLDTLLKGPASSSEPQWMDIEEKKVKKRIRIVRCD